MRYNDKKWRDSVATDPWWIATVLIVVAGLFVWLVLLP